MKRLRRSSSLRLACAALALAARARATAPAPIAPDTAVPPSAANAPAALSLPPHVELVVVGDTPSAGAVEARVLSWFRGQGCEPQSARAKTLDSSAVFQASGATGVRVWVVLQTPTQARVFFAVREPPPAAPRYLVSEVALDRGLDELGQEQLAQVVYLSALALWAGNVESSLADLKAQLALATASTQLPRAATPTSTDKPSKQGTSLVHARFAVDYVVRARGAEGLAQGPALSAAASWSETSRSELGATLHAGLLLPDQPQHGGVKIDVHGASIALGLSGAQRASGRIAVTGELGAGVDVVQYHTLSTSGSLQPAPGATELRPLSYAALGASIRFGAISFNCAALLVVQLLHTHYDIGADSVRTRAIVPWLAQPGLSAGLAW